MHKLKILLLALTLPLLPVTVFAQGQIDAAGLPQIEYLFARVVCTTVPLAFIAMLVMLVIAGVKYLTSGGEAKAIQAAHFTVTWGLLGVLFMAIAWLILQLIQSFTGIQITTFSVSSLTNLPQLSQSCWQSPPLSFRNPTPNTNPDISTNTNITTSKIRAGITAECERIDLQEITPYPIQLCTAQIKDCTNPSLFIPIPDQYANMRVYTKAEDIIPLGDVFTQARNIFVLAGTLDNKLYLLDKDGSLQQIMQSLTASNDPNIWPSYFTYNTVYGRYPKDQLPIELIRAHVEARKIAERLSPESAFDPLGPVLVLTVHKCGDSDYYSARTWSPLIYIKSKDKQVVRIRIHSLILSTLIPMDKTGWWTIVVDKDNLTSLAGKKHRFIPYEFLDVKFEKPKLGIVVEKNELESYLKKTLWPKQGLEPQEITDYWQDIKIRLPEKNYYFISLVDKKIVDKKLPIEIEPKPTSIFRNMLYILPLNQKGAISYEELNLNKLPVIEKGDFTVLENGVFIDD